MNKNLILFAIIALTMVSCGNKTQTESQPTTEATADASVTAASLVNVYYFHGKQRCKTCLAIESVAKNAIETTYKDNPNVKFVEINIDEAQNKAIVEKYEISFSSLVIAKGENRTDLTEQAFANAVSSPDVLAGLIKDEVTKRL